MEIVETVKSLYGQGLAVREIASRLGVSTNRVYKLMRRKGIPRRSVVEANKLAYLRKAATFEPVFIENQKQEILKAAGVMLYWAEGAKSGCFVDFANSDERMVRIFLKFLREICGVKEDKLKIYLYCYPQHDVSALIDYWSDVAGIAKSQFTKPYIRTNATGKYGEKLKHGLIHVRYNDKKLQMLLLNWAGEYCNRFGLKERCPRG